MEPWVDVNPLDPDNIVAFWQQDRWSNGGARGNVAGVSLNGGMSWQIVPVPGLTDCTGGDFQRASDPWVSFGTDGTLHQVSLVFDIDTPPRAPGGFGPNGLAVSKSEDGGLTWSEPVLVSFDDNPRILNDKESITADPDGVHVYVVWDRLQISAGDAINPENVVGVGFKSPFYLARSSDGGNTWEPRRKIYDPGANNQTIGHQLLVLPDDTLVDLFNEILNFRNDDGGPQFDFNLSLLRSPDKGKTWLPRGRALRVAKLLPRTLFTPPPLFIGVYHPDDMSIPLRTADVLPEVAVDRLTGNLYAVWQDSRFSAGGDFSDPSLLIDEIAFSQSTDGGFTWSEPIKVNQTPEVGLPLGNRQAFVPSVRVSDDGTVAVTYYDFRNNDPGDPLQEATTDHFVVHCNLNCSAPASWHDEIPVTDASFDFSQAPNAGGLFLGDYVGLTSESTDFLSVFGQAFSGDPASVFFRRVSGDGP
ncbi:MAG: exo-alpha-sialidase [Gammaproteobacteria bacterium]|nr:exo-alpha-sialidase [Gammaproteobacteria bacterium]NIR85493.1 exo-alpha-sialidase [Gammaproteobacteria bacterium]NIR89545.1 exo-alpha-sialidase [Gammaproteobacteria bacterium]NIU06630.1 exo-alpha-sialidase [Gammaproteobacteria bacterium]NIV53513.1 exo-alpha-sialidase [Gammaproteobacteria bacterium]